MGDPETQASSDPNTGPPRADRSSVRLTSLSLTFWYLVLLFNVALLALSLGLLLIVFDANWTIGTALLLIGGATFLLGYYRYRTVRYST